MPKEGRITSKTLHLQVHTEDYDEDKTSLDSSSMQLASSRHTGKKRHRSAKSLRTREDLKLQVLRSRITSLDAAEGRTLGVTKPKSAWHCQVIAKLAAKKSELEKRLRRRSADFDEAILPIEEDVETDTTAPIPTKPRFWESPLTWGTYGHLPEAAHLLLQCKSEMALSTRSVSLFCNPRTILSLEMKL